MFEAQSTMGRIEDRAEKFPEAESIDYLKARLVLQTTSINV
jgi:hypothetical protein